jgi:hypothetical protein
MQDIHRQHGYVITLFSFFEIREVGKKCKAVEWGGGSVFVLWVSGTLYHEPCA